MRCLLGLLSGRGIYRTDDGYYLANLDYCKGCGICARECWTGCIKMVEEEK